MLIEDSESVIDGHVEPGLADVGTVAAIAVVVFAPSVALHEVAHAVAGFAAGGQPHLISSTDLRGDWSALNPIGFVWLGLSGSLLNWALAWIGLIAFQRLAPMQSTWRALAWLGLTVNGLIASVYMIISPAVGFGDWMTIVSQFNAVGILRGVASTMGIVVTWAWFRTVRRTLGQLVGPGPRMVERSRRIALVGWVTGGALAAAAALMSPLGLRWAIAIAIGSTMGTTWPMLAAARSVHRVPPSQEVGVGPIGRRWGWLVVAGVVAVVFVGGFGRGFTW